MPLWESLALDLCVRIPGQQESCQGQGLKFRGNWFKESFRRNNSHKNNLVLNDRKHKLPCVYQVLLQGLLKAVQGSFDVAIIKILVSGTHTAFILFYRVNIFLNHLQATTSKNNHDCSMEFRKVKEERLNVSSTRSEVFDGETVSCKLQALPAASLIETLDAESRPPG